MYHFDGPEGAQTTTHYGRSAISEILNSRKYSLTQYSGMETANQDPRLLSPLLSGTYLVVLPVVKHSLNTGITQRRTHRVLTGPNRPSLSTKLTRNKLLTANTNSAKLVSIADSQTERVRRSRTVPAAGAPADEWRLARAGHALVLLVEGTVALFHARVGAVPALEELDVAREAGAGGEGVVGGCGGGEARGGEEEGGEVVHGWLLVGLFDDMVFK